MLTWAREKTTHSAPAAAWYLLFAVATLPIALTDAAIGVLASRGHMPQWWSDGGWLAWAVYAALWVWLVITMWRVSRAVTSSTRVAASLVLHGFVVLMFSSWQLRTEEWQPVESYADDEFASFELSQELFDEQLRKTRSFEAAFNAAVPVIKQREIGEKKDDGFSNPQISVGRNIRVVLDELAVH